MNDVAEFKKLINAEHNCISIVTHEEKDAVGVVCQTAFDLKRPLLIWSMGHGVREGMLIESPAEPDTGEPNLGLMHFANLHNESICIVLDIARHLTNELTLRVLRDCIDKAEAHGTTLVLIDSTDSMPSVIKSHSTSFRLSLPNKEELEEFVRETLRSIHFKTPIEIGMTRRGLDAVVRNLRGLTRRQAKRIIKDTVADDHRFDDEDVNRIIAGKRRLLKDEGLLEYIQAPLDINEIGGMLNLKKWLAHRRNAFKPEAFEFGLRPPRGVLMVGVQGAGKSLCAKAIATAWQQPLLRLDVGSLYNKYIGESEHNLRKALKQIEFMSPAILWIDEIEKAFASAASQSNDGGLSKRMFGALLTWMQDHEKPVFLIATANDIGALPPELLRKGRFDEIFFVGLPKESARKAIFKIHLKKRKRKPEDFELDRLVAASDGYSGAEIEQAVIAALYTAFDNQTDLTTEMITQQLKMSPPLSVTMAEKMQDLYAWAEGRCVPAD